MSFHEDADTPEINPNGKRSREKEYSPSPQRHSRNVRFLEPKLASRNGSLPRQDSFIRSFGIKIAGVDVDKMSRVHLEQFLGLSCAEDDLEVETLRHQVIVKALSQLESWQDNLLSRPAKRTRRVIRP